MNSKLLKSLLTLMVLAIGIQLQAQTQSPKKALSFNGSTQYVSGATGISTSLTAITIEAWVYHNTLPGTVQRYITINPEVAVLRYDGTIYGGTNALHFYIKKADGTLYGFKVDNVLSTGTWMHVAGTYDGTTMKLYLNGKLLKTATTTGGLYPPSGGYTFSSSGSEAFNGKMDEVSVWNYARALSDIREDMYRTAPLSNANLKNYWQFNNGSGATLTDMKGTATGTLQNSPTWVASTIPFAAGAVNTQIVSTTGTKTFTGTGLTMNFTTKIGTDTIVASRIDTLPNVSPSGGITAFNSQYWVINRFGTGTFTVNPTFTVTEDITSTQAAHLLQIELYKRSSNGDGTWVPVATAASADAVNNTVTFNGINNFDGQYMVCYDSSPNMVGTALRFDGTNDYVNCGNAASLNITGAITIEAWINADNWNPESWGGTIVSKDNTNSTGYALRCGANGILSFVIGASGGWHEVVSSSDPIMGGGQWTYVVGVYDGTTMLIYIDGKLRGQQALSGSIGVSTQPLFIGNSPGFPNRFFIGKIDEVRLFNVARTQAQIQSDMCNTLTGTETGLVSYWQFNNGSGTVLSDMAETSHGTLTNMDAATCWVESYAMVVPAPAAATNITTTGFTANWTSPAIGKVTSYKLDIATDNTFSAYVSGYNNLDCGLNLSKTVTGLTTGITYYYRVRADKISVIGTGANYYTYATATPCVAAAISSQSTATQTQNFGGTFTAISVTATGSNITYQWYKNTTAANSGGTSLGSNNGAQTNSYTPQATTVGTLYYYCIVSSICGPAQTSAVSGAFIVNPIATAPAGSGTAGAPYQIANLNNLYWLSINTTYWNKSYIQTADIDASQTVNWNSGSGFSPIGNDVTNFQGTYDGQNHTITNLYISRSSTDYVGLFGLIVGSGAGVKNLGLININFTGRDRVAGLAGYLANSSSYINNSYTTGSVNGGEYVGGLIGEFQSGTIDNCYSKANVTGNIKSGGLVGFSGSTNACLISNSHSTGNVVGNNYHAGGLIGDNFAQVSNCYSTGNVSGSGTHYFGGLVGYNAGPISKCYATGNVTGSASSLYVGGLIGSNENMQLSNSYATGSVIGYDYVGGLAGLNVIPVTNCYSTGSVSGSGTNVGGLVGYNDNGYGEVNNCFWDTQTSGQSTSFGGTGLTTEEMKAQNPFTTTPSDWDFTAGIGIWKIENCSYKSYPYLQGFTYDTPGASPAVNPIPGLVQVNTPTTISSQSTAGQTRCLNGTFNPITVTTTGTNLSYQWYWLTSQGNSGGNSLGAPNGAQTYSYTPQAITEGILYYYCVVTGTCETVRSAASGAFITGAVTNISSQNTAAQTECLNGTFYPITVSATGTNLSYQWYWRASSGNSGGTSLGASNGAQTNSYNPQATTVGTQYYYCVVTSTCATVSSASSGAFIVTSIACKYSGGAGTSGNPYKIATLEDLNELSNTITDWVPGKYFIQIADIDATSTITQNSGAGFSPIGNSDSPFEGNYDGQNHTITNLYINRSSMNHVGLFGVIDGSGNGVKNLGLITINITGGDDVGGLVGIISADGSITISHCYTTGSVSGDEYVGGLVGYLWGGNIDNSYSKASVSGNNTVGGLVALKQGGTLSNSYSTGNVNGNKTVGGLVGFSGSLSAVISNCYATGNVTAGGSGSFTAGGLVGDNYGTISKCYATGIVSGIGGCDYIGGLVGIHEGGEVRNSYATGSVSGNNNVGGLVGYNYASANNSYATGSVSGNDNVGGLVGYNAYTVNNSYSVGPVSCSGSNIGGLVGYNDGYGEVNNSFWDTQTSGQTTSFGGTGLTTAEMKTQITFTTTPSNWDFTAGSGIWKIEKCSYLSYPYLQGFTYDTPGASPAVNPIPGLVQVNNNYNISASVNPANSGTVAGAGIYCSGDMVTLTATANSGYSFVNWTENGIQVSVSASYQFVSAENRTLVANFAIITSCIVNIPDANFKAALVAIAGLDANNDGEIQCYEATGWTGTIDVSGKSISDLTGIASFTNITELNCDDNQLASIDISANTGLIYLYCSYNNLSSLNVTSLTLLSGINCGSNQLTSLDLVSNTSLQYLTCSNNSITTLDVSSNSSLRTIYCYNNLLTSLNVQNGNNTYFDDFNASSNTGLTCIQVDNVSWSNAHWSHRDAGAYFSTNCNPPCVNPAIVSQSTATQTQCIDGSFIPVTVSATGTNLTYQWFSNTIESNSGGISLGSSDGANTDSYTPQATTAGTLYYYCVVGGDCGTLQTSAVSGAFTVNALPPPAPTNTTPIANQTICSGNTTNLSASGTGILGWYNAAIGGTWLGSGADYTTPVLTTSTTFYVQDSTCEASTTRTIIAVTVNTQPEISCPTDMVVNAETGQCGAFVNFQPATAIGTPTPTISYSHVSGSFFPIGTTSVTATAGNLCNTVTCLFTISVNDNQAPTITCPANINIAATSAAGAVVTYVPPIGSDNCPGSATTRTAGLASGSTFPIGETIVTHTVTDAAGLISTCSFTVTVTGVAPQIVCPPDITMNIAPGQCGNTVSYNATESTGIPASTITYSIEPGSLFNIGTATVNATASNAVGISTCSFTVSIIDNEAPVANIAALPDVTGECSATATIPAANDNCAGTVPGTTNDALTYNTQGTHVIHWTYSDGNGNTSTQNQNVIINDVTAPVISCPANISAGQCNNVVSFNVTATDNCSGAVTIVSTPAPGSTFPLGLTTVTSTATDAAGNQSECSFQVNILTNPLVNAGYNTGLCQGQDLLLHASGGTSYSWSGPGGFSSYEQNPVISGSLPANPGLYSVTVSNESGCSSSISFEVTFAPLPGQAGTISGNTTVLRGGSYNYSVNIPFADEYIWSYSGTGVTISGITNSVILNFSCNATNGILSVKGRNQCGDGPLTSISIQTQAGSVINIYCSKIITGTGHHPSTVKMAIQPVNETGTKLGFKVFRSNQIGIAAKRKNFDNIWVGSCQGIQGNCNYNPTSNVTELVTVTGPVMTTHGGGPAYKYVMTVPAGKRYLVLAKMEAHVTNCSNNLNAVTPCYVYPGKRTMNRNNHHQYCDEDDDGDDDGDNDPNFQSCNSKSMVLQIIQKANGKISPLNTDAIPGSLLFVSSPTYLEFTDTVDLLPVIYESVNGLWDVSTIASPPEGFYSIPETPLSTEVNTATIDALQFSIVDTGSVWTNTIVTSQIRHNNRDITHFSAPAMLDHKQNADYLFQNYPNPFNSATNIPYYLPENCLVRLSVYNSMGEEIIVLVNETQLKGAYNSHWKACDNFGCDLPSGVYIAHLKAVSTDNGRTVLNTKSMVFIK